VLLKLYSLVMLRLIGADPSWGQGGSSPLPPKLMESCDFPEIADLDSTSSARNSKIKSRTSALFLVLSVELCNRLRQVAGLELHRV